MATQYRLIVRHRDQASVFRAIEHHQLDPTAVLSYHCGMHNVSRYAISMLNGRIHGLLRELKQTHGASLMVQNIMFVPVDLTLAEDYLDRNPELASWCKQMGVEPRQVVDKLLADAYAGDPDLDEMDQ